jgi:hypothetical protein
MVRGLESARFVNERIAYDRTNSPDDIVLGPAGLVTLVEVGSGR